MMAEIVPEPKRGRGGGHGHGENRMFVVVGDRRRIDGKGRWTCALES